MMVNEPSKFIDRMNLSENDILCVHYESEIHIHRVLEMIKNKVKSKLRTILGLDAKVMLESPNTLQRLEGKAKRVKDLRNIK